MCSDRAKLPPPLSSPATDSTSSSLLSNLTLSTNAPTQVPLNAINVPTFGGDAKQLELAPIKLTHASENACVSGCSNASGNACLSRCSIHTLAADRPKKEVQLVVDVVVSAPPGEPQQAPLIMGSGRAWSPGVYWALRLLGITLDVAWERALVSSLTIKN